MFKKLNKKGFTLAELLIVVAIIGVLVAVSIPIFTAQLEKSREATDMANLRAAKAEAVTLVLAGDPGTEATDKAIYDALVGDGVYYNIQKGVLETTKSKALKGTTNDPKTFDGTNEYGYNSNGDYADHAIKVQYSLTNAQITFNLTDAGA